MRTARTRRGSISPAGLHVLPDFHGNRSPLADPHALGVISGLTLDASFDSLCRLYWRTCVAIALGIRHILETLNASGFVIDTLHVTGGHTKNPLLMELYADAAGCTVVEPLADDAVLIGTAMVAATGAGLYPDLVSACAAMQQRGRVRKPDPEAWVRFDRDFRVFLRDAQAPPGARRHPLVDRRLRQATTVSRRRRSSSETMTRPLATTSRMPQIASVLGSSLNTTRPEITAQTVKV